MNTFNIGDKVHKPRTGESGTVTGIISMSYGLPSVIRVKKSLPNDTAQDFVCEPDGLEYLQ